MTVRLGVLASGGGTNLQAIIDASEAGLIDAKVDVVLSDRPGAYALERARKHGIETAVITKKDHPVREDFDRAVTEVLRERRLDLVVLAGFMRILTPVFIRSFPERIMNIHPSLLPSFPGLDVQKKAIEHGARFSGCTVHLVDEGVDTGPIIIQAAVPVLETDTPESLAGRILAEEHRIYPQAVQFFAEGRMEVRGRRVFVKDAEPGPGPEGAVENPRVTIFD